MSQTLNKVFRIFLICICAAPTLASARSLEFRENNMEVTSNGFSPFISAIFHFTAIESVWILDTKSSCDCTRVQMEKQVYKAGEQGNVKVTIRLSGTEGTVTRSVILMTDEQAKNAYELVVTIKTMPAAELSPRYLYWTASDADRPKRVAVVMAPGVTLTKIEVESETFKTWTENASSGPNIYFKPLRLVNSAALARVTFTSPEGLKVVRDISLRVLNSSDVDPFK